jgi:hypothetical protein
MSTWQEPDYDWNAAGDYPGVDFEDEEADYVDSAHEDPDPICTDCDGIGLLHGHLCKTCQGTGQV